MSEAVKRVDALEEVVKKADVLEEEVLSARRLVEEYMGMVTPVKGWTEEPMVGLPEVEVVKDSEKVVATKEMAVVQMETAVNEAEHLEALMVVMLVARMEVFVVEDTELDPEDEVVH